MQQIIEQNHQARLAMLDALRDKVLEDRRHNRHERRVHAKKINHAERRVRAERRGGHE